MKTSDLQGAILDWHTARAEGIPAADLELRANGTLCVRNIRGAPGKIVAVQVLDYSTNWALTGPLVLKWRDHEQLFGMNWNLVMTCTDPMIAICRAVVRAAFGDEVEDLPCA